MIQKFETQLKEIEIFILRLDAFVAENSDLEFIAIYLYLENPNKQDTVFEEENT